MSPSKLKPAFEPECQNEQLHRRDAENAETKSKNRCSLLCIRSACRRTDFWILTTDGASSRSFFIRCVVRDSLVDRVGLALASAAIGAGGQFLAFGLGHFVKLAFAHGVSHAARCAA